MCLIENADSGFSKLGKLVSYRNKYMVFSVNSHLNFSIIILMILKVRDKKNPTSQHQTRVWYRA